jgi:transposase
MLEGLFGLDDLQWSSIKGCLPSRKRRGPRRVDDRRVISGIIHVLQSGMRPRDNDLQPLAPLVTARPVAKDVL